MEENLGIFLHYLIILMFLSPHRVYADAGSAFAMGLIGGSIFHGFKGYRNAPSGFNQSLSFRYFNNFLI
jgi:hypothetical protein